MSKQFFEEAPAAPAPAASGAQDRIRKAARQLAYDTRYKVKKSFGKGQKTDAASMQRAYIQQLGKSSAPGPVKALAKKMLVGEDYVGDVKELVNENLVRALSKVFVEGVEEVVEESEYLKKLFEEEKERKYKVRVSDLKNKTSYVRYATREKISQLRAKGLKVEMTGYGEPYEGEKKQGEQTATALGGGGKAKKDYDGDGKIESGAKEHAGAVHNAIQRKKGGVPDGKDTSSVKEEFIGEEGQDQNEIKLDIKKGIKNKVEIFPDSKVQEAMEVQNTSQPSALQQFQQQQKPDPAIEAKKKQQIMLQKKIEMDKVNQLNKGIPLTQSYNPEGESIEEVAPPGFEGTVKAMKKHPKLSSGKTPEGKEKNIYALAWYMKGKGYKSHKKASGAMKEESDCGCDDEPKVKKTEDGSEDPRSMPTKVNLVKNKLRAMGLKMSYEPEGEVIDEEESDRMRDREQERAGMDRPSRYAGGRNPNKPAAQTGPKKKPADPNAAFNTVVTDLRAKYGPNAVISSMRTRKGAQG